MKVSSVDIGLFAGCDRPRKKLCAERELKPSRNIEWDQGSSSFAFFALAYFAFAFLRNHDVAFPPHWRVRTNMLRSHGRDGNSAHDRHFQFAERLAAQYSTATFFAMHRRDVASKCHGQASRSEISSWA
jgi:hypothetical protein